MKIKSKKLFFKRQKRHNMLKIDVFDLERSHNVSVVGYDNFSAKAMSGRFDNCEYITLQQLRSSTLS